MRTIRAQRVGAEERESLMTVHLNVALSFHFSVRSELVCTEYETGEYQSDWGKWSLGAGCIIAEEVVRQSIRHKA